MTPNPATTGHSHRRRAYVALAAVCLLWGTTYLGIRISLQSFPPLTLIAIRYIISGAILLAIARLSGAYLPRGRELWLTALCGAICIGIGNGFLAIAELWVPSGLAALFYTTAPFWMVGIDGILPAGRRPTSATLAGLFVGLLGVLTLVLPAIRHEGMGGKTITGFALLQISAAGWVFGALLQKRVRAIATPVVTGGVQQLAAGVAVFVPALLFEHVPSTVTSRSMLALGYLVVFGSLVGFSAFIYSMARLPVAVVSIYYFVNPVVAVVLGRIMFDEPFGYPQAVAMLIIFAGIFLVKRSEARLYTASQSRAESTMGA